MTSTVLKRHSLKARTTFATLLIFVIGIGSLAHYASRMPRGDVNGPLGELQVSTVATIASDVNEASKARWNALESMAGRTPSVSMVKRGYLSALSSDKGS